MVRKNIKFYLSFLFILIFMSSFSQHTPPKKGEKWIRAGLFISSIALDAMSDGFYDSNKKVLSKSFKAASIGTLLSVPLFTTVNKKRKLDYVLEFGFMRYAIFDDVYTVSRGYVPFTTYNGTTSVQDKLKSKIPPYLVVMSKFASLGIAFHINDHIHHDKKLRKK